MTCEGCSNPTGCLYIDGCRTCSLRAIIASQPFWQSMRSGRLTPEYIQLLQRFEIDDLGRIKYKFWDKNTAQDRLFKFKGLYEKDHSQATAGLTALRDALVGAVVGPDPAAAQPDDDEDLDERA